MVLLSYFYGREREIWMALQVWLPLNGSIYNQGLNDVSILSRSVTYGTGKIASQGARFNGDCNQYIRIGNTEDFQYDEFTWSVWIYPTSFSVKGFIISHGRDYSKYGVNILVDTNGALNICSEKAWSGITTLILNTWYHIVVSLKKNTIKCYLNGNLVKTFTSDAQIDYGESHGLVVGKMSYSYGSTTSYFPFNGIIQDVRIYDEALSPKQVKLLSQGLVCHYPMGNIDGKIGGRNLLRNSKNLASLSLKDTLAKVERTDTNCKLSLASGVISTSWYAIYTDFTIEKNQSYTASIEIETVNLVSGSRGCHFTAAKIPPNSSWNDFAKVDFKTPGKYHYTFNSGNNTSVRIALGVQGDGSSNYVIAKNLKLEKGTSATSWTPAPEDDASFYDNVIYDTSGYCNNGSVTDSTCPTWSNDTPRYKGSYVFENLHYIKGQTPWGTTPVLEFTISVWINQISGGGHSTFLTSDGYGGSGIWFAVNTEGSGQWAYRGGISPHYARGSSMVSKNTWYLFTYTFKNGLATWYLNGVKQKSTQYDGTTLTFADEFVLGNSYNGTTWNTSFNGKLSDFRIYATALDNQTIEELYEVGASVDNNGNLSTYEIEEEL